MSLPKLFAMYAPAPVSDDFDKMTKWTDVAEKAAHRKSQVQSRYCRHKTADSWPE
jgi:hypothetical protein